MTAPLSLPSGKTMLGNLFTIDAQVQELHLAVAVETAAGGVGRRRLAVVRQRGRRHRHAHRRLRRANNLSQRRASSMSSTLHCAWLSARRLSIQTMVQCVAMST